MICHYDKKHFERPEEFYPNHFIGENGELLTKKDAYAPFSIGERVYNVMSLYLYSGPNLLNVICNLQELLRAHFYCWFYIQ